MTQSNRPAAAVVLVSFCAMAMAGHAITRCSQIDQFPSQTTETDSDAQGEDDEELPLQVPDLMAVFGSAKAIETVRTASTITAYRVPSKEILLDDGLNESAVIGKPVDASPVASLLRNALLDPNIYGWNSAKGCGPRYGVRIEFATVEEKVDVLFCFDCNMLSVYRNGKIFAWGEGDFDSGREHLVKAVKILFPDDKLIQSMTTPRDKWLGL